MAKRQARRTGSGLWRIAMVLAAALVVMAGAAAATVLYVERRVESLLANQPWDVPSRLYPAALDLAPRQKLPPGSLERVLDSMGYARTSRKPVNPGDYQPGADGKLLVLPRPSWPGMLAAPGDPLELRTKDGSVQDLKTVRGKALTKVALPPVPFAEIRGAAQETRRVVKYKDIPRSLLDAVMAIEDQRFLEHPGVDLRGLARAVLTNVVRGEKAQGGSTLTQQLVKNHFLSQEKTYSRKLRELLYAVAVERRFTKPEILELYLNEIYLGQRGPVAVYGVGQAAYAYFSKDVGHLKLEEAALLAGMIQAPNAFAPDRHADRAKARRDVVLDKMQEQGRITAAAADAARKQPVKAVPGRYLGRTAPNFVDAVTETLGDVLPDVTFSSEGCTVETTLDLRVQQVAEEALQEGLRKLDGKAKAPLEGAVVVVQPATGRVLALVGGRDYAQSQFNRATQARRQPGSAFKPLVMLAALHARGPELVPSSLLEDAPLTLTVGGKPWSPRNSDKQFHGQVTLRQTLEQSLNVPTVRLAQDTGMDKIVELYGRLGVAEHVEPVPSLALGVFEVTPLQVATAFTAVATDGVVHPPRMVERVLDAQGKVLWSAPPVDKDATRVASPEEAFLVRDMMRGVLERGTARGARALGYKFEASGKTGTTNDAKDAWFVGLDGELLTVVWVGADTAESVGLMGAQAALPIWVDVMSRVRQASPPPPDPLPPGLTRVSVCTEGHARATTHCPTTVNEVYWEGHAPEAMCPLHAEVADRVEHLLRSFPERLRDLFRQIQD